MSKVIIFSRQFPKYHPKAGEPTHFIEQILNTVFPRNDNGIINLDELNKQIRPYVNDLFLIDGLLKKWHTIRNGTNWKVGDKFSPRIWSGKPYASKQIQFAPDIEIKKVWDFEIIHSDGTGDYDKGIWILIDNIVISDYWVNVLAKNDGLETDDLIAWFNKPMRGQIICWSNEIDYV